MHREFKKLLEKAIGVSEFVIAVNIDIRGFSSFSMKVESSESAVFIKKVYKKLIDEYFPNASFFKPTGDGLLIILPYTEETLKEIVTNTIQACLAVLVNFGSFCTNAPMINFDVPQKVGIGLSRGAACRIVSEDKTLDYSGRVLNLASRLMDLARPSGIVFDTNFGIEILPNKLINLFSRDSVYFKGIAEREPIEIYYTTDYTTISHLNKQPLERIKWKTIEDTKTLKQIKDFGNFFYNLASEPTDTNQIKIRIVHPKVVRGKKVKGFITTFDFSQFQYFLEAGKPKVTVRFDALAKQLESEGVKDNWEVKIEIAYPEN